MDNLPDDRLKNARSINTISQEKLASLCFSSRRTIVDIEAGKKIPNPSLRGRFAKTLSNPILEYFPQYSIGQFSHRLKIRFNHENVAGENFLKNLQQKDIDSFREVFYLYKMASYQKDAVLMILLDEYLHTRIMNAHPDEQTRILVGRYRQDYIEFFKIWLPQLNLNITLEQSSIHLNIFQAILDLDACQLSQAIGLHLINSLNDVKRIINALEDN
jgi:transcriptional regulator with XRE-family HTH domain